MSDSGAGGWLVLGLFGLAIYSCSGPNASDSADESTYSDTAYADAGVSYADTDKAREPFDEDAAREAAQDELASQTYEDVGSPYGCTSDCSGHDAGFAWAADGHEDGGISNSQSFDEGQRAYAEALAERVEEMRDDYNNGEDPGY